MSTLVSTIKKIKLDLDAAKADILTLKGENKSLHIENKDLKSRLVNCETNLGICDKSMETSSTQATSSSEISSSDDGKDSDNETHHARRPKTLCKKVKKNKKCITCETASSLKSQTVPLVGGSITTFAFIGGVSQACSQFSIKEHITDNIKLNVSLNDIQLLHTRRDLRVFKVAIPLTDLQKLIMSDWPS